ncbi:MAG TPA: hypothetical protein PKO06_17825 [Candidatus Ozemobacteraceae bacterium]|nr:hypothetical protein [Candidatus Ozemobacteraceae bacterium]
MNRQLRSMIVLWCGVIWLFAYGSSFGAGMETAATSASGLEFFPLEKGNMWVYEGPVTWTPAGGKSTTATLTVTMEVLETIERDHVFAALVSGYPGDTAMYDPGEAREPSLIVRVGPVWYYLISGRDRISSITKRLRDQDDVLFDLVQPGDLWLMSPLIPGCLYGEADQITRTDRSYCWQVEAVEEANLETYLPQTKTSGRKYRLANRVSSSYEQLDFVPGVGVVEYAYVHHGTPFESHLRLLRCRVRSRDRETGAPSSSAVTPPVSEPVSLERALQLALEHVKQKGVDLTAQHLGSVTRQYDAAKKQPYWHVQWQWNTPKMGGEYGLAVFMDGTISDRRCGP